MLYDYIVVGAGYGGIASASLLAKRGFKVLVLEAHNLIGGCASYFKREDFLFDVGATTLSGFREGQPIKKLLDELEIDFPVKKIDPGIIIKKGHLNFYWYSDWDKFVDELKRKINDLPEKKLSLFFEKMKNISKRAWELLDRNPNLMPKNIFGYFSLIKNIKDIDLFMLMFKPVNELLIEYGLYKDEKLKSVLDEILLISTQSKSNEAPSLSAALAFEYPGELYYSMGGTYKLAQKLMEKFIELGGEIKFKQKAVSVREENSFYRINTHKSESYRATNLVLNIPIWNIADITESSIQRYFKKLSKKYNKAWGAFTIYFAIKDVGDLGSHFYQIHCDPIPNCDSNSYFVSFSDPEDREKAPEGWRTVTISTHTKSDPWLGHFQEDYSKLKDETEKFILESFFNNFPQFESSSIQYLNSGTPRTFDFFTSRYQGKVGGIPHTVSNPLPLLPNQTTPFKGLYHVGDTSFPGQGIGTVIYSAQSLMEKI